MQTHAYLTDPSDAEWARLEPLLSTAHSGRPRHHGLRTMVNALLRTFDTIYLEDLLVANMVRSHHLAKRISDAGWSAFRTILDGKAADAGHRVVAVPPAFTSQDCSGCGERLPQSLSVRTHCCATCGLILDRDEHAAGNIVWGGQALRDSWECLRDGTEQPLAFRHGEHVTAVHGQEPPAPAVSGLCGPGRSTDDCPLAQ